jgi:hypothetical protein
MFYLHLIIVDRRSALSTLKGSPGREGGAGVPARGKFRVDRAERSPPTPKIRFFRNSVPLCGISHPPELFPETYTTEWYLVKKKKEALYKAHNSHTGLQNSSDFEILRKISSVARIE